MYYYLFLKLIKWNNGFLKLPPKNLVSLSQEASYSRKLIRRKKVEERKENNFIFKWAKFGPFGPFLHLTHSSITYHFQ